MSSFLLELASEEIPARMQAAAAEQLRNRFVEGMKAAGLAHGAMVADATPRRLWLIAHDVADASAASSEERKGPSATAPEAAIAGFLRSTGLARAQLEERETPKGVVLFAHIASPGRSAATILAELVPAIVRDFQWPKSMRWGAGTVRWVRPLTGVVALLGGEVVACEAHGVASGRVTRGHRIMGGVVSVETAGSYATQLLAEKVVVSSGERRDLIVAGAAAVAAVKGLSVIPDAGLVAENAGLTEWPVPMLGGFDPAFLAVPHEVIQLTMRTNQKYFAVADADGALAPGFVCVANLVASDGGSAIIAGNERVLSARLADAKFFWDQDVAAVSGPEGLGVFAPKLAHIVFHEKLGTVADKVERVAKLARWLVESGAISLPLEGGGDTRACAAGGGGPLSAHEPTPTRAGVSAPSLASPLQGEGSLADLAERAARLAKADLVSATVSEFPEVQGIAGAYLARLAGEDAAVADAIRDHYKPVGQGDNVPTAPVSVAVALADKLDNLVAFDNVGIKPTGSRDPFALRRAALSAITTIVSNGIRINLADAVLKSSFIFDKVRTISKTPQLSGLYGRIENAIYSKKYEYGKPPTFDFVAEIDDVRGPDSPGFERVLLIGLNSVERQVVFLTERLKILQREAGVRHDLIDAIFALGSEDDLVRLLARVKALQAFVATDDGVNLLAGYKRAANILRIELAKDGNSPAPAPSRKREGSEAGLAAALDAALPSAAAAVRAEDFEAAMMALAGLRAPVDAFFADVMVNDPDPAVRSDRLALLARFRDAVHEVADFSKIEG